jgi:hypothetical protein
VVGDGQVQPDVAGHEVLQLVSHGADQRTVGAEVLDAGQGRRFTLVRSRVRTRDGLGASVRRRQVRTAGQAADLVHTAKNPGLDRHDSAR